MKQKLLISLIAIIAFTKPGISQEQAVDVTDQTIKIGGAGGSKDLYFGFAEGDQIVFSFKEADGKKLKQIDISEYPGTPEFSDYKTSEIDKKVIHINHKGIYQFHFENGALGGRICQITIQRIPAGDATKNFNTDVVWKNVNDTTYDEGTERYLIKSDTASIDLSSPAILVHSRLNLTEDNHEYFFFRLPENTIKWAYYIGVGQEGAKEFEDATGKAAKVVSKIPGYGALTALALYGVQLFTTLQSGESITYALVEGEQNRDLFMHDQGGYQEYKEGNVINDFERMTSPINGNLYFCFKNTNKVQASTITLKINAITVTQQWGTRPVKHMSVVTKNLPFNAN